MKLLGLLSLFFLWQAAHSEKIINCYYDSNNFNRPGEGIFLPVFIDPQLCTHLSYGHFGITAKGEMIHKNSDLDNIKGLIRSVNNLKYQNPNLKLIAVVGNGVKENSKKYNEMAEHPYWRTTFANSSVSFIKSIHFDGMMLHLEQMIDLDFKVSGEFLAEIKELFDRHGLELSVAVSACGAVNNAFNKRQPGHEWSYYDPKDINKFVHYINLIVFTRYLPTEDKLDHFLTLPEVHSAIDLWTKNGVPANKIVLGVGAFSHTFKMADVAKNTVGDKSNGTGNSGPFTRTNGVLGYNEICKKGWTHVLNVQKDVSYATKGNQWVSFENEYSMQLKMDVVNSRNMAGAMMYTLANDDFRGRCGRPYPLLNVINNALRSTDKDKPNKGCKSDGSTDGYHLLGNKCSEFYRCFGGTRYNIKCPGGDKFEIEYLELN